MTMRKVNLYAKKTRAELIRDLERARPYMEASDLIESECDQSIALIRLMRESAELSDNWTVKMALNGFIDSFFRIQCAIWDAQEKKG